MWSRLSRVMSSAACGLTAAVLIVITASVFHLDRVPILIAAGLVCLAVVAAVRPDRALLTVAAVTPLATYILRRWNPGVTWAETLVVAFGAGWYSRRLFVRNERPLPAALRLPLIVFACVVLASLTVQLSVEQARLGTSELAGWMLRYISRDYFVSGSDRYLHAAAFLLEGLLLFSVSARVAAADGRFARHLAGTLAASTAVAAALNLLQLVDSARRFDNFWGMLVQHISTARLNTHYGDVNAAGSVFAMLVFVSAGLTLAARRRAAPMWGIATAFIGLGLWMSGSRTALVAAAVALASLAVVAARTQMSTRARLMTNVACLLMTLAAIAVIYAPTRGNQQASSVAVRVRVEMARTTLRMVAEKPLFGVGLGEFYQRSGEFSSPELLAAFPPARHENAHNNFLQILAEAGLIGLGAFLCLLAAALYVAARPLSTIPRDAFAWGSVAGLFAFLLTCFGGHPLLTREAGYAFWLVLGLAAGYASLTTSRKTMATALPRWPSRTALIVIACLVISIPIRAASARAHADLEHLGIGLSQRWETAEDGTRFRSAVTDASIFVPAGTGFRFRVRTETPERLELKLGGRLADVVTLVPSRWTDISIPARSEHGDARFTRLDLQVVGAEQRPVTIWISKVEQLGQ